MASFIGIFAVVVTLLLLFDPSTCTGTCSTNVTVNVAVTGEDTECVYIFTRAKDEDGTCPSLQKAAKELTDDTPDSAVDDDLIAYYPLDSDATDHSNNNHNGESFGSVQHTSDAICGDGSAFFDGASRIAVDSFNNFEWGSAFSVSTWFKRTGQFDYYQGIVNSGLHRFGSWEIRMGREDSGTMIGGGVVNVRNTYVWRYMGITASQNEWHHVAMTYDGEAGSLKFYLDGVAQEGDSDCCSGPILARNNPLTIGQAGPGAYSQHFYGFIDEVKLFKKTLTAADVNELFTNPCGE